MTINQKIAYLAKTIEEFGEVAIKKVKQKDKKIKELEQENLLLKEEVEQLEEKVIRLQTSYDRFRK